MLSTGLRICRWVDQSSLIWNKISGRRRLSFIPPFYPEAVYITLPYSRKIIPMLPTFITETETALHLPTTPNSPTTGFSLFGTGASRPMSLHIPIDASLLSSSLLVKLAFYHFLFVGNLSLIFICGSLWVREWPNVLFVFCVFLCFSIFGPR